MEAEYLKNPIPAGLSVYLIEVGTGKRMANSAVSGTRVPSPSPKHLECPAPRQHLHAVRTPKILTPYAEKVLAPNTVGRL